MSEQRQRRFEDQPSGDPESVIALADDHPAILCNTTVFGSTIVSAGDSQGLLISGANNRKIGKVVTKGAWKGMAIYTLTLTERMTCPASCHMIRECYGNSMPFARRHLPGEDFEKRLRTEVVEKARLHRGGFVVRLHVLGDFYSAGYVRVWRDLLNTVPELHLFGYTATGTSALPSDVEIVSEIEGLNEDYPDQCFIRFSDPETIPGGAVVISRHPEAAIVPEGTVCPAEREATACCATCALCWEKPARGKAIVFVKHGLGASTTASAAKMASKTDANNMRSVAPIKAAAQLAGKIRNKPPILLWVRPIELYVDETYQRNLSKKSIRLITKIVQEWDWTHMKPPIAVKDAATGRLFLLDGQHTAIAAASHPDVEQIPVMIVEAESLSSRARAFIGHNRDRINVTPLQLHHSGVVAEDAQAVEIAAVCRDAGVTVLRHPPANGRFGHGETVALGGIRSILRLYGAIQAKTILQCLVKADRAPIRADEMRAVGLMLKAGAMGPISVIAALRSVSYADAEAEATRVQTDSGLSRAEALAAIYTTRAAKAVQEAAE